ncbi:MAG: ATP-binding cassette domain-containing protein, partial [Rhabdochlamydiaceae bacterium]
SNGSGKSSLIKVINGLSKPTRGEVVFKGRSLKSSPISERAKEIVTLTQDLNLSTFSHLTVLENCLIALHRNKKISFSISIKSQQEKIAHFLRQYNSCLCDKLDEPVYALSGGERQTLAFAMSIWSLPQLLLLDEHTSALDPHRARNLMRLTQEVISQNKMTAVVATHNLDDALHYGNRLIAMNKGKIILDLDSEQKNNCTKETLLSAYTQTN